MMMFTKAVMFNRFFAVILVAGMCLAPATKAPLAVVQYFVDYTGSGSICTQAAPCDLATALTNVGSSSESEFDIFLAAGTYTGTGDEVILIDDYNKVTRLHGGWDGTTASPIQIDPDMNQSIIDGEDTRRGITITGDGIHPLTPVIDGLWITKGNGSGLTTECSGAFGAGVASGCGGGLLINYASPMIMGNHIFNNTASKSGVNRGYGGGIFAFNADGGVISGNRIYENLADDTNQGQGGGVMLVYNNSTTEFDHNLVYENSSGPLAKHTYGAGLALFLDDTHVHDNEFTGNGEVDSTNIEGGAIYLWYGNPTIEDNFISGNYGQSAVLLGYGPGYNFLRNRLFDNHTYTALYLLGTDRSATDCTDMEYGKVVNNFISHTDEIGLSINGHDPEGVCAYIQHNSIDGADTGIYLVDSFTGVVTNNIISNHAVYGIEEFALVNPLTVENTLFYNNTDNGFIGNNWLIGNPRYVNSSSGDLHIVWGSAAVDTGIDLSTVIIDIDQDPRPLSLHVDIGADEIRPFLYLPLIKRP
jgi:hypothetical protein